MMLAAKLLLGGLGQVGLVRFALVVALDMAKLVQALDGFLLGR
jgi:hypothetical protein